MKKIKSFKEFRDQLSEDKDLQDQMKTDPLATINSFEAIPPSDDKIIYRLVVIILGMVVVLTISAVIFIALKSGGSDVDKMIPTILTATCSAAIGALTGLLAPSPRTE
jgi:archaellum biogenesis protein FlaJ (TadC family)